MKGWLFDFVLGLVVIAAAIWLVSCAVHAQEPEHPFRDAIKWAPLPALAQVFDDYTSVRWSSYPSNCEEGTLSRRNPDGTVNGWKAAGQDAATTAALIGALYVTKKFHRRRLEHIALGAIGLMAGQSVRYGLKSVRLCHAK